MKEEGRGVCSRACSKTLGALSILAARRLPLPPVSCRPLQQRAWRYFILKVYCKEVFCKVYMREKINSLIVILTV